MSSPNQTPASDTPLPEGYKRVPRSLTPPDDGYLRLLRNGGHIAFKELIQSISPEDGQLSVAMQRYNADKNAKSLSPNIAAGTWPSELIQEYDVYKAKAVERDTAKAESWAAEMKYKKGQGVSDEIRLSLQVERITKLRQWFEAALT
ncbi:hypothetical protein GGR55DRAFT_702445 [Xylaria sp. FL0064]|nr:hypothetical protein GGR55DRAFT_702445 [Xylaria sp. FL0064]